MSRATFDTLLIGTGPPMLFEGLSLAAKGQRIIFVDRASEIGGSWRTPAVLGYRNVEVGVHLIENRPHLNALLERLLGAGALVRHPPDFGLILGRRVPIRPARVLLYALAAVKALVKGRRERASHALRNSLSGLVHSRAPLIYPAEGFGAVLDALTCRLNAAGAEFRFNTVVDRVEVTKHGIVAATDQGALLARRLVMSSRAHAPIVGVEQLCMSATTTVVHSLVMKAIDSEVGFDGYVEVIGDEILKRARNISRFTVPRPPAGTVMIVAQLRRPLDQLDDRELSAELLTRMRRLKLLGPRGVIAGIVRDEVTLNTLTKARATRIARLYPSQVTVLRTVDLSDRVHLPSL
jgi:hypothetical protein